MPLCEPLRVEQNVRNLLRAQRLKVLSYVLNENARGAREEPEKVFDVFSVARLPEFRSRNYVASWRFIY